MQDNQCHCCLLLSILNVALFAVDKVLIFWLVYVAEETNLNQVNMTFS